LVFLQASGRAPVADAVRVQPLKETTMKGFFLAAATLLLAGGAALQPASAQAFIHYPFCIYTGGMDSGFERCNYRTFEQCLFDRQAEGGVCYSNPSYVHARGYEQQPRRRHYR
jgi:hypothetical protein